LTISQQLRLHPQTPTLLNTAVVTPFKIQKFLAMLLGEFAFLSIICYLVSLSLTKISDIPQNTFSVKKGASTKLQVPVTLYRKVTGNLKS